MRPSQLLVRHSSHRVLRLAPHIGREQTHRGTLWLLSPPVPYSHRRVRERSTLSRPSMRRWQLSESRGTFALALCEGQQKQHEASFIVSSTATRSAVLGAQPVTSQSALPSSMLSTPSSGFAGSVYACLRLHGASVDADRVRRNRWFVDGERSQGSGAQRVRLA